ncbi:MAG: hypothetical protein AAF483_16090 [Planctomycetota bacterium]
MHKDSIENHELAAMLGLSGNSEQSFEPAAREAMLEARKKYFEQIKENEREAAVVEQHSSTRLRKTSKRAGAKRFGSLTKIAVGLLCTAALLGTWSVVEANAARQRGQQEFTIRNLESAFDLFCEDKELIRECSDAANRGLPSAPYLPGRIARDWHELAHFNESLLLLLQVKDGTLRPIGMNVAGSDQFVSPTVQLLINVANGKARFETLQSMAAQGRLSEADRSLLFESGRTNFENAMTYLDSGFAREQGISEDDETLLATSVAIDATRLELKYLRSRELSFDEELSLYKEFERRFASLQKTLDSVSAEECMPQKLVLEYRLKGNLLLLQGRLAWMGVLEDFDLNTLIDEVSVQETHVNQKLPETNRYKSSYQFERAIYLSNVADLISQLNDSGEIGRRDLLIQERDFRGQVIDQLALIPVSKRTMRYDENLALNLLRKLACQACILIADDNLRRDFQTLRNQAEGVKPLLGPIFEQKIGQVLARNRLLVAEILDYPRADIEAFYDRIPHDISRSREFFAIEAIRQLRKEESNFN